MKERLQMWAESISALLVFGALIAGGCFMLYFLLGGR